MTKPIWEHPLVGVVLGAILGAVPTLMSVHMLGVQERARAVAEHRTEAARDWLRSCSNFRTAADGELELSEQIVAAAKQKASHDELIRLSTRLARARDRYSLAEQELEANFELMRLMFGFSTSERPAASSHRPADIEKSEINEQFIAQLEREISDSRARNRSALAECRQISADLLRIAG